MAMFLRSRPNPADDPEASGLLKISPAAEDGKKKEQSVPLQQILLRKVKLCGWKKLLALLLFAITLLRMVWNIQTVLDIEVLAKLELQRENYYRELPFSVPVLFVFGVLGPLIGAAAFVPFFWRFDRKSRLHWVSLIGCLCVNFFSVLANWSVLLGPTFLTFFNVTRPWRQFGPVFIRSIRLYDLGWRLTSQFYVSAWLCQVSLHATRVGFPHAKDWLWDPTDLVIVALGPATIFFLKANAMQREAKERDTKEHASAHKQMFYLRLGAGLAAMDALFLPLLHKLEPLLHKLEERPVERGDLFGTPFCVADDAWVLFSILSLGGAIGPHAKAKGKRVNFDIFAANKCLKMCLQALLALLLFVSTVLRMVQRSNVKFYSWPSGSHLPMEDMEVLHVIFGLLQPLIGAVAFVPFFWRFDWKSRLHWRSLAGCLCVNFFSVLLDSNVLLDVDLPKRGFLELVMLFRWMSRLCLVEVTGLKLASLGWQASGFVYTPAWIFWLVLHGILRISGSVIFHVLDRICVQVAPLPILTLWPAMILFREASNQQQLTKDAAPKDPELQTQALRTASLLRLGACLTIIHAFYLSLVEIFWCDSDFFNTVGTLPTFCTVDDVLVLFSILVLSGIVGPRGALELDQLHDELVYMYMARTKGNRIAFPGKINSHSPHCIVSFPGSYAAEWDAAVRQVQLRSGAVSLACVFLTDPASGLGRHASNPDQPGCCWCRALYGHLTKEAYLSIVEEPRKLKQEELDFKKIDAAAMGQVFLVKQDGESDADWQVRKEAAEKEAEELCEQKQGLAPWGCEWFHLWKNRVKEAHRLGQTLHVFYFQGKVGQGKMAWADLANKALVKQVRENTGLGGSQTAEVAYLEKSGYTFAEHDVADFFDFMEDHRHAVK